MRAVHSMGRRIAQCVGLSTSGDNVQAGPTAPKLEHAPNRVTGTRADRGGTGWETNRCPRVAAAILPRLVSEGTAGTALLDRRETLYRW